MALDVAIAAHCELQGAMTAGREAAEQIPRGGAGRHFSDQFGHVGRARIRMDEGRVGLEPHTVANRQRSHARENAVLVGRQFAEHDGQRRLVEVLDVRRRNTHADSAGPVRDLRQLGAEMIEDFLGVAGVVVRDVEEPQRWTAGVVVQGDLRAKLREDQPRRHLPLGMRGVTERKQFHDGSGRPVTGWPFWRPF